MDDGSASSDDIHVDTRRRPDGVRLQGAIRRGAFAGSFLLLLILAVSVPTAYDTYWPQYTLSWKAITWVLVACAVTTVEFTALSIPGTETLELAPLHAAVGAFLITNLGNFAWLSVWQRQ